MPATFGRLHNWTTEVLFPTDLDNEFNNLLNNLDPTGVGSYSVNVAQMQLQTNPGGLGSESLATACGGEFERLRYVIARLIGTSVQYWYQAPPGTLTSIIQALGSGGLPANRIISGQTTGNSSQLCCLFPSGTTSSVTLSASTTTPFQYYVNGTAYSITAAVTFNLALASNASATSLIAMVDPIVALANGGQSRGYGMYGTTMGLISASASWPTNALVGFQLVGTLGTPGATEYCIGFSNSTAAMLDVWRGCFFSSAGANVLGIDLVGAVTSASQLTVLKMGWIFANTSLGLAVTYDVPTISSSTPSGAATGDYWFNLGTSAWMTFNSSNWVTANATLIGMTLQTTGACVAARTFDSYVAVSKTNDVQLTASGTAALVANDLFSRVQIFSTLNDFKISKPQWSMASNLDSGLTISASTTYFFYMKENGTPVISQKYPIFRRDLQGYYHPGETWRALGVANTDSNTGFTVGARSFLEQVYPTSFFLDPNWYGTAGYSSVLNYTTQATESLPLRFLQGQFSGAPSSGGGFYYDVATVSLTPGYWIFSGMCIASYSSGTPQSTNFAFALGNGQGTANTGIFNGLNQAQGAFLNNLGGTPNVTVSSTTGSITSTGAITPANFSINGFGLNAVVVGGAVVPRYIFKSGINATTYYVKVAVGQTGSGVMAMSGSWLFEKMDTSWQGPS